MGKEQKKEEIKTLVEEMEALDPNAELVEYKEPELPPPPSFNTVLLEFLKVLSNSTSDLHKLNCPAVLISGVSILEFVQHWGDHPELLAALSDSEDPQDRIKGVVKWIISTLWGSFASRTPKTGFERKPYNPILGEQFLGFWPEHGQELTVEQVSHHPPISAFYLVNKKAGVHVNGFIGQVTKFTGTSIRYQQPGRTYVFIEKYREEYYITMPELHIRGLLNGQPFVEITGSIDVLGTNDWAARLNFIPKPWFSGVYDCMEGVIFNNLSGATIYDLWGNWKKVIYCAPHQAGRTFDDLVSFTDVPPNPSYIFYNVASSPPIKPKIHPLDKQNDLESQKLWFLVTLSLQNKDYKKAAEIKNILEEQERALKRERQRNKEEWHPSLFRYEKFYFMPNIDTSSHTPSNLSMLSSNTSINSNHGNKSSSISEDDEQMKPVDQNFKMEGRYIFKQFYDQFVS